MKYRHKKRVAPAPGASSVSAASASAASLVMALCFLLCCIFPAPGAVVYARDGVGGFDGSGVSSGEAPGRTVHDFQEYVFVTGSPVLLKGTLVISKSESNGRTTSAYSYKLSSDARAIQLTRDIQYETTSEAKGNGQTVTQTVLTREPSEKIVTANQTYTLRRMDFARTSLIDERPAVHYYSGNTWYRKHYEVGGGAVTSSSGDYLTVEATGQFYGFDQAWGSADIEDMDYVIDYTQSVMTTGDSGVRELWSGSANVRRSQSIITDLRYVENEPQAISFRGGFLETRRNDNVLEFSARLPEFDAAGVATDRLQRYTDSTQISMFPSVKRLVSPDLRQINGHWAEEAISKLFGLEILSSRPSEYVPDQYITRAGFAAALVAAAKPVPEDPSIRQRRTTGGTRQGRAQAPAPSFTDVPADHVYYAQIEEAFARGLMGPIDKLEFRPNQRVRVADAAVTLIRALGLEAVASAHGAITEYADDVGIPAYARDALYVAQKIGLLRGDERGNINPLRELTEAEAAVILDRLVSYMMADLKADYRERIMDY
ncbi:MAG: S-layer homology domain-containing protein [Oscillospiraceae bacterium]|nr:S-layer homology domain-containing protein [Oscillospiraceae bacterium]